MQYGEAQGDISAYVLRIGERPVRFPSGRLVQNVRTKRTKSHGGGLHATFAAGFWAAPRAREDFLVTRRAVSNATNCLSEVYLFASMQVSGSLFAFWFGLSALMSDFPLLLRLPCLVVVFMALLRGSPGLTQSFDASGLDRPTPLGGTWLMKPGDDPAYAQPDYDDSSWTRMDLSHDLHDYVRGPRPEVVWYRLHLRTSPTQTDLALATYEFGRAWEIYANGSRILQLGHVVPYDLQS
jgi:hypothetical protein